MKRGWIELLKLTLIVVLVGAALLPSVIERRNNPLRGLAQSYFEQVRKTEWPARTGPCPTAPTDAQVVSCKLDYTTPEYPTVTFSLQDGQNVVLTQESVRP